MRTKIISIVCIISLLIFVLPVGANSDNPVGTITSFTISNSGTVEVIGYYDNTDWKETTILLIRGTDLTEGITAEDIMYIGQEPMGENNTFYYRFKIDRKFSQQPCTLAISGGALLTVTNVIPDILAVADVANNALRVGNDFYDIGHAAYTADNISHSIEEGGNIIYYKIGDMWFDMLDEEAIDVDFFVIQNAVAEETITHWEMNNYYHF